MLRRLSFRTVLRAFQNGNVAAETSDNLHSIVSPSSELSVLFSTAIIGKRLVPNSRGVSVFIAENAGAVHWDCMLKSASELLQTRLQA